MLKLEGISPRLCLSCTNVRLADERKGTTGTSDPSGSSEPVQAQTTTGLGVTAPTSEKTGLQMREWSVVWLLKDDLV